MRRFNAAGITSVGIVKGDERYVFTYDDDDRSRLEVWKAIWRLAADENISFTGYDAVRVATACPDITLAVE